MKLITPLFILMILLAIGTVYADVACEVNRHGTNKLTITGTIKSRDVIAARKCIENADNLYYLVTLNSIGGDVYAAMELGRLLRKNRLSVSLFEPEQCMSSCVLVLAGAVYRTVFTGAEIGIHRPYSLKTGVLDFEDTQSQYQKVRSDIQNYLNEMNIPSYLFDAMERIPPEESKILTEQEIDQFGLSGIDPVEKEVRDADAADLRGISKQEYLRRISEASQKCDSDDKFVDFVICEPAYSWGLTKSVYIKRFTKYMDICKEVEKEFGYNSNEHRKCEREVMLGVRQ